MSGITVPATIHRFACVVAAFVMAALANSACGTTRAQELDSAVHIDFDRALAGLNFDPRGDSNLDSGSRGNGIPDSDELALLAEILANPGLDLRSAGGVSHASVRRAFDQALSSALLDKASVLPTWPTAAEVAAGFAMLGAGSFESYNSMSRALGTPLVSDYTLALDVGRYLSHDGDADGDGWSNRAEYIAFGGDGRAAYIQAALDPRIVPDSDLVVSPLPVDNQKTVGIVLYPGFEVLDVYGPLEMWAYIPDFNVVMVAEKAGPVRSAQGVSTVAEYSFDNAPQIDILMVPGGIGTRTELTNEKMLGFIRDRSAASEYTTSVCTGSALLAAAGVLSGRRATSNKRVFSLAIEQDPTVDWVGEARWVEDGKFITSSGVSAGTDMALGLIASLYGVERASALARSLEYVWNPDSANDPFAVMLPSR